MHLQTTSPESKFPHEYNDVIFIQIDQHLKKFLPKYKGVPVLWNTVYIETLTREGKSPRIDRVTDTRLTASFPGHPG